MANSLKLRPSAVISGLLLVLIFGFACPGTAGDPGSADYSADNNRVFWFIQTSDTHIGARGTTDGNNLKWLVNQARSIIAPDFIMVTGDLTDSTNGNFLGIPSGPYQKEWDEYKNILSAAGAGAANYYDIPGNHDGYNDASFSYYRNNSVQGRATGNTQVSFVKTPGFGTYHFMGVNTADNTGAGFSLSWPYGDYAGLDGPELSFINNKMSENQGADLTLVFGHHPLFETGNAQDTYVYYGGDTFLSYMDQYSASLYGYGHTHAFSEAFYIPDVNPSGGFFYFNVNSLGKSSSNQYTIMAIDCNGLSSKTLTINTWPAVLITAPVDANLGGHNPYSYSVPAAPSNPIRALVFDANTVTSVQYRIDGAAVWNTMARVAGNSRLWEATWNASGLSAAQHTIEVRATSASGTRSDAIAVNITQTQPPEMPTIGADFTEIGRYIGSRKTKIWEPTTAFDQGDKIVFKLEVNDDSGSAVAGAQVQLSISGPSPATITSSVSDSSGAAEAVWQTSAPNKRGVGGTTPGDYEAAIAGITASGFVWDGSSSPRAFTLDAK